MIFGTLTAVAMKSTVSWEVTHVSLPVFTPTPHFACLLLARLLSDPEGGGSMFCQNISELLPCYMASYPRR
jgi:hypothetical protein